MDEIINGWTFEETIKTAENLMEAEKNLFKRDVIRHLRDFAETYREQLKEYQQLEEQGRFVKLPCKVGDVVWNYSYFGLRDYKVTYMGFDKNGLLYFDCKSGITYGFRCYLKDFKDKIFLTKFEAEAKLKELRKELRGEENER